MLRLVAALRRDFVTDVSMFDLARSAFVWLHRSWALQLLATLALPALLLVHTLHDDLLPPWLAGSLAAIIAIVVLLVAATHAWLQGRPPKRDRTRPMLQQIQDDTREDATIEELLGLHPVSQPPPPAPVAALIRVLGRPLPNPIETAVQALVMIAVVLFITSLPSSVDSVSRAASYLRLGDVPFERAHVAFGSLLIITMATIHRWAADWRARLIGGGDPAQTFTAYGPSRG